MRKKNPRLWRMIGSSVILGAILMSSCGPSASPAAPSNAQPAIATAGTQSAVEQPPPASPVVSENAPRSGGTVVFAIEADPPSLMPATTDSNTVSVASKIFNGLVVDDTSFQPVPGSSLALSWDVSQDGKTYTIKLRQGVKWQDGVPFTCDDVKYSYTDFLPKYHPKGKDNFGNIDTFDCPDDYTAVITLKHPFSPFMSVTRFDGGAIVPKHIYEGTDVLNNPANMKPVGTGPYMLQEWVRGDHITLVRNPNYFMKGRPFLDKIIFKIIPDPQATIAAFEAGEVDFIPDYRVDKSAVADLEAMDGVVVGKDLEPPKKVMLFFNLVDCEICKNLQVRQAIAYAINKQQIIDLTMFGLAQPGVSPIPPAYPWAFNKDAVEPSYDPDMANKLLDEAGYPRGPDGTRFTLTLTYQADYARVERPNEVLVQQLKAVGIDLKLNPLERNTMIEEVHHKYNFELYDHLYSAGVDPALGIDRAYRCSAIDNTQSFVNVSRYCNQRVDDLFDQAASTSDLKQRAQDYYEIQDILLKDLPIIDLFLPSDTPVGKDQFVGLFSTAFASDESWDWVWWTGGQPMADGSFEPIAYSN